jgi:ribosomal-protein-alanine N-acetyltransferase
MPVDVQRVRRADAPELIAANRESVAYHAPWITGFTDQAGFDTWFARGITGPNVSLIARERATGALVGVVNLNEIVLGAFRSAYLSYWGYVRFGGSGLMTEALREAVRYAFEELGLHRVEASIQPGNARSIALVQRVGLSKEGFSPKLLFIDGAWRDHEHWALLADALSS